MLCAAAIVVLGALITLFSHVDALGDTGDKCDNAHPCKANLACIPESMKNNQATCQALFTKKKHAACASTYECKEGLYCQLQPTDDQGTCKSRQQLATCFGSSGDRDICAHGYGCNNHFIGSDAGICTKYNSQTAGTGTGSQAQTSAFCKPWLMANCTQGPLGLDCFCAEPQTQSDCTEAKIDGYGHFAIWEDGKCKRIGNDNCVSLFSKWRHPDPYSRAVLEPAYNEYFYYMCQSNSSGWGKAIFARWTFSWIGIILLVAACVLFACCCGCGCALAFTFYKQKKATQYH